MIKRLRKKWFGKKETTTVYCVMFKETDDDIFTIVCFYDYNEALEYVDRVLDMTKDGTVVQLYNATLV
jgi:hypothetical protein